MNAKFYPRRVLVSLLLISFVSACSTVTPARAMTPVTVQLSWTHMAEFAGMYAAAQNGYHAAAESACPLVSS